MKGVYTKRLVGALVWVVGMWMLESLAGNWIRVLFILLGFIAMWSLWVAREERGDNWKPKMQDIWMCHILFIFASVEANVELFYRNVSPTWGAYLVSYIFVLTVLGAFENKNDTYTYTYTGLYTREPH